MSESLRGGVQHPMGLTLPISKGRANARTRLRIPTPVPVMIAGIAIIATRCLGVLMLTNNLGMEGMSSFIDTSSRSWDLTLLFLSSLTVLFLEIHCGFAAIRGRSWSRWCFLICQVAGAGYLLLASWYAFYPEMFALSGDSAGELLGQVILHKLPDLIMLLLLFMPSASRRFFARRR